MQSSIRLPYIKSALERYDGQFSTMMRSRYLEPIELWTDDEHLNKFIGLVEASVDLDQLENMEYMISPTYSTTLANLKEQQHLLDNQIQNNKLQQNNYNKSYILILCLRGNMGFCHTCHLRYS